MKCPTKEQILYASKTSVAAKTVLVRLFPEVFERPVIPGQLYSWGTDNDGGSGLIVHYPEKNIFSGYQFINFRTGDIYISRIAKDITRYDLQTMMKMEQFKRGTKIFHNCFDGDLRGPYRFKSWCTK